MTSLRPFYPRRESALLDRMAKACQRAGGTAYLVGGCVREALRSQPSADLDVEVFGIGPETLEAILHSLAPTEQVGRSFGVYKLKGWPIDVSLPRTETPTGSHHRSFAVTVDPQLPMANAAKRRDFTVNAIYYQWERDQLIDPLGGTADLAAGRLRHCSAQFAEDPLRVLRAMQFAARLSAQLAPETVQLARTLTPANIAPERFQWEWEKLIRLGQRPSLGLEVLRQTNWLRWFPELQALVGCPQDPQWHPEGDVYQHTLHCMDAFARQRKPSQSDEEILTVGLAVLCHDMGKPAVTALSNGRIRSPGHERAGIKPARSFLQRIHQPARRSEAILRLVRCHMRPDSLYRHQSSDNAIRRLARDVGRMDWLLQLYLADAGGRPPYDTSHAETVLQWLAERSRQLSVDRSSPQPLLRGRDLIERGWSPGPPVGQFLARAFEAQMEGRFTTREEALSWLDHSLPAGGNSDSPESQPAEEE